MMFVDKASDQSCSAIRDKELPLRGPPTIPKHSPQECAVEILQCHGGEWALLATRPWKVTGCGMIEYDVVPMMMLDHLITSNETLRTICTAMVGSIYPSQWNYSSIASSYIWAGSRLHWKWHLQIANHIRYTLRCQKPTPEVRTCCKKLARCRNAVSGTL